MSKTPAKAPGTAAVKRMAAIALSITRDDAPDAPDALNRRRKALRAYEKARSLYMGFIVSPHDWSHDPRMEEARVATVRAWQKYEAADIGVSLVTGIGGDDWTHKP